MKKKTPNKIQNKRHEMIQYNPYNNNVLTISVYKSLI